MIAYTLVACFMRDLVHVLFKTDELEVNEMPLVIKI